MKRNMAADQDILQLELLCKHLYESNDGVQRAEAEKALVNFQNSPDSLAKCQLLLERASSSYAQLLAASTLTKMVSRPAQIISLQHRIQIRNYILTYLVTRPKLDNFVLQALAVLVGRITKLGWFDSEEDEFVFRNLITDIRNFLQGSVEHCTIGIQLLSVLTSEMNEVSEADARALSRHRRVASSFRDQQLLEIFRLSCTLLKNALESGKTTNLDESLMNQLLRLAQSCLTFDFIGTSSDESSDENSTVQIPTHWRSTFLDGGALQLFFDLYHHLPATVSSTALSCLVQMASIRRSLFSNTERVKFLTGLVSGVKHILLNPQGLGDTNNYHEFCRLLARLKSNYQLGELVVIDCYKEAIQLIAKFTVDSLAQMLPVAPNSVHYLLNLWQRLVASVPYVSATEPHMLETYTPEITRAYINSRIESVGVALREGKEDPLDDTAMLTQQLDQLSIIGRCEYQKTCGVIVQFFDQTAQNYQAELQKGVAALPLDLALQEGHLTWLVYIIGAAIGGRVSFNANEEHDGMDGELVCRVLQLMQLTDSRLGQGGPGSERLESAFLSLFEQFRKIYVGDQVLKATKVYRRLSEVLGLNDETMMLTVFMRKIIANLKNWGRCEFLLSKTLNLLGDLSMGYNSVRKLVKLEEVQYLLNNHTGENFPFLGLNQNSTDLRFRTAFYKALGRLLIVDLGEDEDKFLAFMAPLTAQIQGVAQLLGNGGEAAMYGNEEVKWTIVGLARDLRGIVYAFISRIPYMMFFDWIYPAYIQILQKAVELWFHDPVVTTPILKLFGELVQNRSQRLLFQVSCPNGTLLFREASKMFCAYGDRILTLDVPKAQLYPLKLKGISICFWMLKAALCGNYANFGVFRLYGDPAVDNVLNCFVKLLLSIPLADLMDFPKLSVTYYVLLEVIAQDHISFLASLDPNILLYILSSVSEGLNAHETMICAGCCATLDHIFVKQANFFLGIIAKNRPRRAPLFPLENNERVLQTVEQHPEVLQRMLETVLNIVMFEECRNQWSMSRPLLGLILSNEEYFGKLRANIIQNQVPEKQSSMAEGFDKLMNGIERSLASKNRDRFTQNLAVFRKDINESLKGGAKISSSTKDSGDMMACG
ncbi:Exportin-7 [Orchesella cincta]|uniref:Exportin-7 n=1 Tax=Orchesella cincta TaxID=48709 RepID=A0A1D2MI78_ORCCI|nr:Exportin-7 [Orchesella cincta]